MHYFQSKSFAKTDGNDFAGIIKVRQRRRTKLEEKILGNADEETLEYWWAEISSLAVSSLLDRKQNVGRRQKKGSIRRPPHGIAK